MIRIALVIRTPSLSSCSKSALCYLLFTVVCLFSSLSHALLSGGDRLLYALGRRDARYTEKDRHVEMLCK